MNSDDAYEEESRLSHGRRTLRVAYAFMIFTSLSVITQYVVARGTDRLPVQVIRFGLTIAMCFWIHTGRRSARYVSSALIGLGGCAFLGASFSLPHVLDGLNFALIGIAYLWVVYTLLGRSSARDFLEWKRAGSSQINSEWQ